MRSRARAVLLTCAAIVAATSPASPALAAGDGHAPSRAATGQALTWSIVPSPNKQVLQNQLNSVSCVSPSACTAVGSTHPRFGDSVHTLAESWNGTAWSIVPIPDKSSINFLDGVSCVSPGDCTAVGTHYKRPAEPRTLVESWNGTAWSIVPSPNRGDRGTQNLLKGISCPSADACTAVGFVVYLHNLPFRTLIESWNGTAWSVVPSPNPPSNHPHKQASYLQGVSCISATDCIAVGAAGGGGRSGAALVESWNGTAWSIVPTPGTGGDDILYGVSCVSATACTAVGDSFLSGGPSRALTESWDGSTWSIVPSPHPGAVSGLSGVSCVSANDCTAVGYSQTSSNGPASTLVESWDGSTWSVVPSPNAGGATDSNDLVSASCVSATTCTAVGDDVRPKGTSLTGVKTLVEAGSSAGLRR